MRLHTACALALGALIAAHAPAAFAQSAPEAGPPVVAGSTEEELGNSLWRALTTASTEERHAFADTRTGPRFAESLGGPEDVRKAYDDLHGTLAGATLTGIEQGPDHSVILEIRTASGGRVKLHCLLGVAMADGRVKVGGWALFD